MEKIRDYINNTLQGIPNKGEYSKEFIRLLENAIHYATDEDGIAVITVEYLIERTLEYQKDSFMYRSLNSVMSVFSIESVMERISSSEMFDYGVVRPGAVAKLSPSVLKYISLAEKEQKKMASKSITSDHILLAILAEKERSTIKDAIEMSGGNYETIFDAASKLHDITTEISETDAAMADESNPAIDKETVKEKNNKKSSKSAEKLKLKIDSIINDRNSRNSNVSFCKHMNNLASIGKFESVVGRETEIDKIEKVLARRVCNNVILVGKSGCGKSAIVNGLAKMIYEQTAPLSLLNKTIYSLDIMMLVGGTTLRGMLQERIIKVFKELSAINGSILFIDDIHVYDASTDDMKTIPQIMSAINQNPEIPVIMTTTEEGYRSLTNNNPDLRRRFQRINIEELSEENSEKVIDYLISVYEDYHKVTYDKSAVKLCVGLAKRYISERALPSSAIDIIDEAGAKKKLEISQPEELKHTLKEISDTKQLINDATNRDDIDLRDKLYATLEGLRIRANDIIDSKHDGTVSENDIYAAVAEHTGIPVSKLNISEKKQLAKIEDIMKERIVGQDEAIKNIANAIKRNKAGLYKRSKPLYSAFFDGVTGVGKSLTAKVLAEHVFGDEKYLIRFDMSEYTDKTAVNKLIGTGAGYIGYDNGGLLTEAVKNKKYAVLLFDEIEKADDSVYNIMLQILDEAQVTDNKGDKVDFKNTIVLFTSNVGAKKALYERTIGFGTDTDMGAAEGNSMAKEVLAKELKKEFPPEFLNRLDDIVYFNKLSDDNLKTIIKLELDNCKDRIKKAGYEFSYNDGVVDFIYNDIQEEKEYGARPILRSIEKNIENEVSDIIISEDDVIGFNTFSENEKLVVESKKR